MGDTGLARFPPGNLDPRAQEFRPRTNNFFTTPQVPLVPPPPPQHQIFYPFPPPQTLPFTTDVAILGYHHQQYPPPPAYVRTSPSLPPEPASPTRTLALSSVPCDVSDTLIRRELEAFGEVRGVQMDRICDGIVTVHFYDLRHAESALNEIREQHMQHQARLRNIFTSFAQNSGHEQTMVSLPLLPPPPPARGIVAGCAVWAQFVIPSCTAVPDGQNQGTIVVFNLDPNVSTKSLREIFQAFGEVKELRETPMKKQQRFVEFYDVRDAAKALREMNGKEIHAKQVLIEFSRPGGYGRKFLNANTSKAFCFSTSNHNCADNTKIFKHGPPQPPPPPPPLPRRFSGFLPSSNNVSPRARIVVQSQSSSSAKGSPKESMNEKGSIEVSVSSLSLGGGDDGGVTEKAVDAPPKRNAKSKSCQSNSTVFKQQQRSKPWKGKQAKKLDTRFLINETMEESNCSTDSRTTVMIKNIPNKYSQKLLLNMLDNHCIHCNEQISEGDDDQPISSYDFVYLPIDFNNKCNVGYGFVNMTSPQATWRLYKAFHHQHWEVFNSRKICEVTYARVQGLEALKEHFKNSKFPCEMDHYLPVVFSPPRDGRQQTEPIPIVGHKPIIFGLPSNKPTNDIDQMNGGDDLRNVKEDDTDQEEQEREGMMNCNSGSCSHSQNGGDMGDDDKDKA